MKQLMKNGLHIYAGALTNSVISEIHPSKFRRVQFIVNDPTNTFTDVISWQQLEKKALR